MRVPPKSAVFFAGSMVLGALGAREMVHHRPGESSGWMMLALAASMALLNAARRALHAGQDFNASRAAEGLATRGFRLVAGVILCLLGIGFCAMGVPLLREETTVAIAVCLVPGTAMFFVGGRLALDRRRADGKFAHPAVRAGAGVMFAGIGVVGLAYVLARKGFGAPIDLVFPVVYVALGVAFARGRLGA